MTWLLLFAVAAKAAEFTWALYQPGGDAPVASSAPLVATATPNLDLGALQQAALFGSPAQAVVAAAVPVAVPQVKSRLAVKLLGIIRGNAPGLAVAILEEKNQQRAYAVGDRLVIDNRAELVEILVDRVVLDVAGQRQFIELEQALDRPGVAQIQPAATNGALPQRINLNQPDIRAVLGDFRHKVVSDPLSFGRFVQLRPFAENGRLSGYQLQPGRDGRLFRQLGLQPGDVVTHVGGVDITDPKNIPQLMDLVQSQQRISIGIRRGDTTQDIDVEL